MTFSPLGLGWIPDVPDPRDFTADHGCVRDVLSDLPDSQTPRPHEVDLRFGDEGELYLTEAPNQGSVHSSSAFAVLRLIEYFERRVYGRPFSGSARFLYSTARHLRRTSGDAGVDLRSTFKALVRFGIADEQFWRYDPGAVDVEPPAFVYSAARHVPSLAYYRILGKGNPSRQHAHGKDHWSVLQSYLAAGFPFVFGFSVTSSITNDSHIPFRPDRDSVIGGMSAIAMGYDLHRFGRNRPGLRIAPSWGTDWGDEGVGWLPAAFIHSGMAEDFWTVIYRTHLDPTDFSRPSVVE